jgi:hypothetical protein
MAAVAKSRIGIYGIVALVIIGVTLLSVVAYRVYYSVVAATPEKAARLYLDSLDKGDMLKLYDMTLGAAGQTQAEFAAMIGSLAKDKRLDVAGAAIEPLGRQGNSYYFRVQSKLRTSDGSYRLAPLILEAGQEGNIWRVAVYASPAAFPLSQ